MGCLADVLRRSLTSLLPVLLRRPNMDRREFLQTSAVAARNRRHESVKRPCSCGDSRFRVAAGGDEGAAREVAVRDMHLREHRRGQARLSRGRRRRSRVEDLFAGRSPAFHAEGRRRVAPLRLEHLLVVPRQARRPALPDRAGVEVEPHSHRRREGPAESQDAQGDRAGSDRESGRPLGPAHGRTACRPARS